MMAEPIKSAYIQGVLARGDRRVSRALYRAHCSGGAKSFSRAMKEEGLNEEFYLYREYGEREILPWDVLDMGIKKEHLHLQMLFKIGMYSFTTGASWSRSSS